MDVFEEILRLRDQGRKGVLATIVHTQGSIPSYQSSKMLVRDDGSIAGTVGGGCVEADVWSAAKDVLAQGSPRKLTFNLNADPRYDTGLTCGGTLEVYLEPLSPGASPTVFDEIRRLKQANYRSVLATVVQAPVSAAALLNAKLLLGEDGFRFGGFGDERLEAQTLAAAQRQLEIEKPCKLVFQREGQEPVEIALEPVLPQPNCVLLGAGHVGQYVSRLAALAGFRVVVADDRAQYANPGRFPQAAEIHTDEWEKIFERLQPDNNAYLVIVTRGHKEDMRVLRWAVGTTARYIGLIGSRRKILSIYKVLEEEGVSPDRLVHVRAPIGIDIGALTPEEIAVSIVAELIAVRRKVDAPNPLTVGNDLIRRPTAPSTSG